VTTTLRHITFPSQNATLNLICQKTRSNQVDFSNFLSVLDAKFLSSFVIRSLSLQGLDTTTVPGPGLRFLVRPTTVRQYHPYSPSPTPSPPLDLVLTWSSSNLQTYVKVLIAVYNAMDLRTLTQLQLSSSLHIDPKTWVKTFGKLPLLERVHVKNDVVYSFLDALRHKTEAADRSITAYRSVSFPKLRYISMSGTQFECIPVDKLMDILMERYERNAEIQALQLEDCHNILEDDVERLREIVVDVDWDGIEQGFSDEYDSEERDYDSDGNTIDEFGDYDSDYYHPFIGW